MFLIAGSEAFSGLIHIACADGEDDVAGLRDGGKEVGQLRKARAIDAAGNLVGKVLELTPTVFDSRAA